ncbi:hypothetical protein DESC_970059 [Desulfosarcina cetonica]|nr:hypothetical protein DESC_970059 [Desulfosarcina cetonica]
MGPQKRCKYFFYKVIIKLFSESGLFSFAVYAPSVVDTSYHKNIGQRLNKLGFVHFMLPADRGCLKISSFRQIKITIGKN